MSDMKSSLVMSARTKVEQEPNYSFVTARILLDELRSEALTFLNIAEESSHPEMEKYYPQAFQAYIDKGIELQMLDPQLMIEIINSPIWDFKLYMTGTLFTIRILGTNYHKSFL